MFAIAGIAIGAFLADVCDFIQGKPSWIQSGWTRLRGLR